MSENLTVGKDVVVGLAYTLYVENAVEDSAPASDPLEYIHGHGNLISGLEKELEGMAIGDKKNVTIEPEEAYGEYDPENVIELERSLFPADFPIEKGRMVPLEDDQGNHLHSYILGEAVEVLRFRHPHPYLQLICANPQARFHGYLA